MKGIHTSTAKRHISLQTQIHIHLDENINLNSKNKPPEIGLGRFIDIKMLMTASENSRTGLSEYSQHADVLSILVRLETQARMNQLVL